MKIRISVLLIAAAALLSASGTKTPSGQDRTQVFSSVAKRFAEPGNEFRPAPFWVWNGKVTREDADRMLEDFKEQGFGGVFIHPRPGMETIYLSDEWFDLWLYSLEKCRQLGLETWIYDENSYPSGFAGGHVQTDWPESWNHPTELEPTVTEKLPEDLSPYCICLKQEGESFRDITGEPRTDDPGRYYLYKGIIPPSQRWLGGFPYVDLLYPGTTQHFIDITMGPYKRELGKELGRSVKGSFTDEPHWQKWTPGMTEAFRDDWGYDLTTSLPLMKEETGDWKQFRYRFHATKLRLFIDNWSKPWNRYCEDNNLIWTGHYWEHEWPNLRNGGDNMAMYEYHQMPGIDMLFNVYDPVSPLAQWGNVRSVKELRSAANQTGQTRTLSESYGGGGWDLTFQDFKRYADWEYALGVNFMCQHYSGVTIEGVRKFDYPDFFTRYSPWWSNYKVLNDHVARLSLVLSQGEQRNDILLIEPNSTVWMYASHRYTQPRVMEIGKAFQSLVTSLNSDQVEFDLGSETIIRNLGSVRDGRLVVGKREYSTVIIPPMCENLFPSTAALLADFAKNGGRIIALSEPCLEDAVESGRLRALWQIPSVSRSLDLPGNGHIRIQQVERGDLQHQRREFSDGELLFLANSSLEKKAAGRVELIGAGLEVLDTFTGEIFRDDHALVSDGKVSFEYDLPPAGHLLVFAPRKGKGLKRLQALQRVSSDGAVPLEPASPLEVKRLEDNYLTLEFCDLTVDGKTTGDLFVADANLSLFDHFGWTDPWEKRVQYKDDIIACDTLSTGDITVTYRFEAKGGTDWSGLEFVCEKPRLWEVRINGNEVLPMEGVHPLDSRNGCYAIGKHVRNGTNTITLHRNPMSVYAEISFAFIKGGFSVEPSDTGWTIVPAREIGPGSWKDQGMPFYSWGVSYSQTFDVPAAGSKFLRLGGWNGTVCEVLVNGKKAGTIFARPWEIDLSDALKTGTNHVEVRCTGSLVNLYGPHFKPRYGKMCPNDWYTGARPCAASRYILEDYGLDGGFSLLVKQ